MTLAIRAEALGKQYKIGVNRSYDTLRDQLAGAARRLIGRGKPPDAGAGYVWAVDDVSFEIQQGEAVGIIGHNGAGKSTLLKILSRITRPTRGRVELYGRVGSLLEVGTGFHSELTGRENIYMNAAILGMTRRETRARFDEIVDFAGVEKFIDTPVKRYSSGMYMRLAFAVAAHLESEILVVDEVLAVGDSAFQKKSLGKMGEVGKQGRTVLFVSHNLGALASLCPRAILLAQGCKIADGPTQQVIEKYVDMGRHSNGERVWSDEATAPASDKVRLQAVRIIVDDEITADADIQKDIHIEVELATLKPDCLVSISIHLYDQMGIGVLASANWHSTNLIVDDWYNKPYPIGIFRTRCTVPSNFLNEGRYSINAVILTNNTHVEILENDAVAFTVYDTGAMRNGYGGGWLGVVRPRLAWSTQQVEDATQAAIYREIP